MPIFAEKRVKSAVFWVVIWVVNLVDLPVIFGEKPKFFDFLKLKFFRKMRVHRTRHVAAVDMSRPYVYKRLWNACLLAVGRKGMAQIVEMVCGEIPFEHVGHHFVVGRKFFVRERKILFQLGRDRDLAVGLRFPLSAFPVRYGDEVFIESCAVQFVSADPRIEEKDKCIKRI